MSFFGKFGPTIENCLFKVKLESKTNSNMQNLIVASILCVRLEVPFLGYRLGKFGPKNQIRQFKPKICTYTNLNMKNSLVMFIFSVFDWKCPFLEICSINQNSLLKL